MTENKEKQPCWLARLFRAMKRRHWETEREAIPDAQVLIQASIALIMINIIVIVMQVAARVIGGTPWIK